MLECDGKSGKSLIQNFIIKYLYSSFIKIKWPSSGNEISASKLKKCIIVTKIRLAALNNAFSLCSWLIMNIRKENKWISRELDELHNANSLMKIAFTLASVSIKYSFLFKWKQVIDLEKLYIQKNEW